MHTEHSPRLKFLSANKGKIKKRILQITLKRQTNKERNEKKWRLQFISVYFVYTVDSDSLFFFKKMKL